MSRTRPSSGPVSRTARVITLGAVSAAAGMVLAGCGGSGPETGPLLLGGPGTDIVVTIPPGWHQVINSNNPVVPEMVAPITCMGRKEESCATGIVRIATLVAPNAQAAEHIVGQGILATPGVKMGATVSEGPGKVGQHDGYLHKFTFTNPGAALTAEVVAVPSGTGKPDAHGNHEYSVALVEVSNKPGAPQPDVIDQIIASAKVSPGNDQPPV